ncbi:MAG: hypothetical protein K2X38_18210 [Gemmataceae bacterium]|nr:hypothetical protein [Gemmataceae bacterium]
MSPTALTLTFALLAAAGKGQFREPPQGPARPYVELPIPPGTEEFLRKQLFKANESRRIQDLLNAIKQSKDFDLRKLNPENLPGFDLNDPAIRDRLKNLIGPDGPKLDPAKLLEIKKLIEERIQDIKEKGPAKVDDDPANPQANNPVGDQQAQQKRDAAKWMEDLVKQAEDGRWGDLIKDSPTLQKAITDIAGNLGRKGFDPGKLDWLQKFKFERGKLPEWRPQIGGLPRIEMSRPRVNLDFLPKMPNIGFGRPRFGGVPSGPSSWSALAWLPLVLVGIVIAILLYRNRGSFFGERRLRASGADGLLAIDPNCPLSRDDFLRAFEQLAIAKLGPQVRTWNHIAASHDLETATGQAAACRELGRLYEKARYAPLEVPLSETDRTEASRLLAQAAGASAA